MEAEFLKRACDRRVFGMANNMTKLESYQRGASFAATTFFADIVGHPEDPAVARALEELRFHSKSVRLLGTYPQARKRGE